MSKTPEPMRRSWLVQRLTKPIRTGILGPDNPFAFGGGLRNGGLSDDAMSLLRGIFAFDYMGAAEFEFGAVPKALQKIAANKTLTATSFDIDRSDVKPDWDDKSKPEGSATVYVLADRAWLADVEERIRGWAAEPYANLKEPTHLSSSLRPFREWDGETAGWLELDNGFMFFTDREMWEQTAALFGVRAEVSA